MNSTFSVLPMLEYVSAKVGDENIRMKPTFNVLPMLEYVSAKVGEMRTSV